MLLDIGFILVCIIVWRLDNKVNALERILSRNVHTCYQQTKFKISSPDDWRGVYGTGKKLDKPE